MAHSGQNATAAVTPNTAPPSPNDHVAHAGIGTANAAIIKTPPPMARSRRSQFGRLRLNMIVLLGDGWPVFNRIGIGRDCARLGEDFHGSARTKRPDVDSNRL